MMNDIGHIGRIYEEFEELRREIRHDLRRTRRELEWLLLLTGAAYGLGLGILLLNLLIKFFR